MSRSGAIFGPIRCANPLDSYAIVVSIRCGLRVCAGITLYVTIYSLGVDFPGVAAVEIEIM